MKSILMVLFSIVSAPSAFACAGGHLKSLVVGEREVATVDIVQNKILILDKKAELFFVGHSPGNGAEVVRIICSTPNSGEAVCEADQSLDVDLTSEPNSVLTVGVLLDSHREVNFTVTNFRLARGGCGGTVEGR